LADGGALPETSVDPGVREGIAALGEQAKQDIRFCTSPAYTNFTPAQPEAPNPKIDPPGHSSETRHSTDCALCKAGAVAGGITCALGVLYGCSGVMWFPPGYAVCLGIGLGICAVAEVAAQAVCDHKICCPVGCGGLACCFESEVCLDTSRGVCCSEGFNPCAATNCCPPTDTCIPNGTCCPKNRVVCGNACCDEFEKCSGQKCCAKPCGGSCCTIQEECIDEAHGTCCARGRAVCGGACCNEGDECVGGSCCPGGQACGGICCPTGQKCNDPATRSCALCAVGTVSCTTTYWNGSGPLGPSVCCTPGMACCNGVCCGQNQVCCTAGGVPGCHLRNECLR
jgi:hypothetical protein